jgi:hypothetical protein
MDYVDYAGWLNAHFKIKLNGNDLKVSQLLRKLLVPVVIDDALTGVDALLLRAG